jgi:hypothetical protein
VDDQNTGLFRSPLEHTGHHRRYPTAKTTSTYFLAAPSQMSGSRVTLAPDPHRQYLFTFVRCNNGKLFFENARFEEYSSINLQWVAGVRGGFGPTH